MLGTHFNVRSITIIKQFSTCSHLSFDLNTKPPQYPTAKSMMMKDLIITCSPFGDNIISSPFQFPYSHTPAPPYPLSFNPLLATSFPLLFPLLFFSIVTYIQLKHKNESNYFDALKDDVKYTIKSSVCTEDFIITAPNVAQP